MEMWFSEFHTPDVKHSIRVDRQLYSKQSAYQRIDIFETPEFGRVLTLDGNVMLTERDEFIYDEMITHVPMSVHRNAKDILVIGAGDGGVVRELTRYDRVERIDLVEMDPQVIEACRAYLPSNACRMDDRRVHIYYENALKFIRKCEDEYDLIIVDSSDPFGPSEGLFTREFYGSCYNALREDGIMVNQQGSPFYAEDATAMQRSHQRIATTFPISKVYQAHIPTFAAGYWLFGFASKKYHPINDLDANQWNALNMRTRYYTTRLHVGAFYLPAFLEEMLKILKIKEKLHQMPETLSGGQQQRAAIARALLAKPAVILADEPTGSLDSETGMEVMGLLRTCAARFHQTVIVVTHQEEVAQMADRIICMSDGRLAADSDEEKRWEERF